jgi:tetratricopeptide (TPR) repeat protein
VLLDQQGASMELVRAHHDILSTSRRIANVLARAHRAKEIHRHLASIKGIGSDRDLTARAEILAENPTAEAYGELASLLRSDENASDPAAALETCLAGLERFPTDASLLTAAGGDARTLGRIDQAIALYEAALRGSTDVDTAVALRLGKLYGERISRLASSGRPTAASSAWHDVIKFTAGVAKQHPNVVWQQAAAIAESALGKGLASQGLIDDGRRALTASIERAPSIDAYETLTTIEVQVDRYGDAQRWAAAGIAMLGSASSGDRYRRAKLERLSADAQRRAGKQRDAAAHYLDSLRSWASLGETKDLPHSVAAERLLDSGRAMWWLGDFPRAVDLVMAAVDVDPDSPQITANAVAFLIEAGRYRDALDAYHRGLGEPGGNELYKVYMSLWILGEAKRQGEKPDRIATDYLASRGGDLWYELLARAATGKVSFASLRAAATTGPRKGELAFYGAVLGLDPAAATPDGKRKLLKEVVDARVVMDAEYDLARLYLSVP